MYAMDWRQYMPDLGRFSAMDMLSESYIDSTPYHFGLNNPIAFSDPTGMYTNTHNGYLFTRTDEIAVLQQYFGNGGSVGNLGGFMSENETFKADIPGIDFDGKGNKETWNLGGNYLFNSYAMYNAILAGLNNWNFQTKAEAMSESLAGVRGDGPIQYVGGADDPFGIFEVGGMILASSDNRAMNIAAIPLLMVTGHEANALRVLAAEKGLLIQASQKKGLVKAEYLFENINDAKNFGSSVLGPSKIRMYDETGKWIGWENKSGNQVYWKHGDWGKGKGSSTFPHINYNIEGQKGHFYLKDRMIDRGEWNSFKTYYKNYFNP